MLWAKNPMVHKSPWQECCLELGSLEADPPSPAPAWGWAESRPSWHAPLQNQIPSRGAKILPGAAGSGQECFR